MILWFIWFTDFNGGYNLTSLHGIFHEVLVVFMFFLNQHSHHKGGPEVAKVQLCPTVPLRQVKMVQ